MRKKPDEWRVVVTGNSGDGFMYAFRKVVYDDEVYPIVSMDEASGYSMNGLRARIKDFEKALAKPALRIRDSVIIEEI